MPMNSNLPASDYTAYLKAKAIAANNTREARLNDVTLPTNLLNVALKTSVMAQRVDPNTAVLAPPTPHSLPANRVNHPYAKSTITNVSPGVTR